MKKRPQEFLFGKRIYNVNKLKNGRGDICGLCYLPKQFIGKKISIQEISKAEQELIEVVKREYSPRKLSNNALCKKRVHNKEKIVSKYLKGGIK